MRRPDPNARPVYSTDPDAVLPGSGKPPATASSSRAGKRAGSRVRLRLEKSGRAGKAVTVITGLSGGPDAIRGLARELKSHCGSGGTVKETGGGIAVEVQGDHREKIALYLRAKGIDAS